MSPAEAQNYSGQTLNPADFMGAWNAQIGKASALPPSYSPPKVEDLSSVGTAHVAAIQATPMFRGTYGPAAQFKMIEVSKLIAVQQHVDLEVSDGVHGAALTSAPSEQDVLNTCLPPTIISPAKALWQVIPKRPGSSTASVTISSTDLTFDVAQNFPQVNNIAGQISVVVASGANLMQVRQHGDRYALANGYHRAYALRKRGVEMVPVVLISVPSVNELAPGPGFFGPQLLASARPPLVADFADDELATTTDVRAMMKVVRVTVESLLVPRML
jgi:hypothetical protein